MDAGASWRDAISGDGVAPRVVAARHRAVRTAHARETAEDYVRTIADLERRDGRCRVVDLAAMFGVTHVTVVRTVERLAKEGFVVTEPYRPVTLTDKGRRLAKRVRDRRQLVERFLESIGVPSVAAARDAEGIEHHVSKETLARMKAALKSGG